MENVEFNYVDTTQTIISIATGSGQLEHGIELAGTRLRVAVYVEIEAFIIANLVAAMQKGVLANAPVWADIKTFPGQPFHRKIHGITAGYPCQPFSNAGQRKGTEDPRHIFPDILRVVTEVRPLWCFFENVEGHLTLGFNEVYQRLADLGYTVEAGLFSAEEVGAPHQRKRLFILAVVGNPKHLGSYAGTQHRSNGTPICNAQEGQGKTIQFEGASELADPNQHDRGTNPGEFQKEAEAIETTSREQNRQRGGAKPCNSNPHVADTHNTGFKEHGRGITAQKKQLATKHGNYWPSRPGQPQHKWEAPRTIKPGLGCSANGYNFRTDLLRMYGNGVVPQTAAKAWITLWDKTLKTKSL